MPRRNYPKTRSSNTNNCFLRSSLTETSNHCYRVEKNTFSLIILSSSFVAFLCCMTDFPRKNKGQIFLYDSRTRLIRTLVIRIAVSSDRLGPSGNFVENSTKLNCRETTGYQIKYSALLWLVELQIRCGRQF